jgi:DNA-binding GntR family transcriptional regulator
MRTQEASHDGRRLVARHRVRESLEKMILDGERPPGAKLVQQQLAKRFGVAQGVVREALLELQAFGLVETVDNRGIFVSELSIKRLLDSFDVREVHEGLAAKLCCDRITRMQLHDLEQLVDRICALSREDRRMEAAELDREFHHHLVHCSGNSTLIRLANNYRVLGKVIQLTRDPDMVRAEHRDILRAIEAGHADDAERLARLHIQTARRDVEREIARGTFVPRWVAGNPAPEMPAPKTRSEPGRA